MGSRNIEAWVINLKEREDRMKLFAENKFPFKVNRFDAIRTDPGWVGCTQSHFSILQIYKKLPVLIMEDDMILIQDWKVVEQSISELPEDWDALWLGATLCIKQLRHSEHLFRLKGGLCAHAIIYKSERIIKYIIDNHVRFFNTCPNRKTIDVFYCDEIQHIFNCFLVYPYAATQRAGYSDIERSGQDYTNIINNPDL